MSKRFIYLFLSIFLILSLVSISAVPPFAEEGSFTEGIFVEYTPLGTFKIGDTLQINAHTFNISNGVELDNSTVICKFSLFNRTQYHIINNINMTFETVGNDWEYILTEGNISTPSDYAYLIDCQDSTNKLGGFVAVEFEVTRNGKAPPNDIVKVVFFAMFLFILFYAFSSFLKILGHWKELNVDLMDVANAWGLYFITWTFYYLVINYLGDKLIEDLLNIFLYVGAITHILVPITAFIASLLFNPFRKGGKYE